MSKSRWEEYREKNGVTPLSLLNPNTKTVDDIKHKERYDICQNCEFFIPLTKQCKKCGCFMNVKTKLHAAKCPMAKWE